MGEEFKILLGVTLDESGLSSVKDHLKKTKFEISPKLSVQDFVNSEKEIQKRINTFTQEIQRSWDGIDVKKAEQSAKKYFNTILSGVQQTAKEAARFRTMKDAIDVGDYDVKFKSIEAGFKKAGASADDAKAKTETARNAVKEFIDAFASGDQGRIQSAYDNIAKSVRTVENELKTAKIDAQELLQPLEGASKMRLENRIVKWLQQNTAATKEAQEAMRGYLAEIQNGVSVQRGSAIGAEIDGWSNKMRAMGKLGSSVFQTLKKDMSKFTQWFSASMIIMRVINQFRQGVQTVKDLDAAMTNINYTMNVSSKQLDNIARSAVDMAKELRTSTNNVLGAVTLYANANETAESILEKTRTAVSLSNVSGVSAGDAADMLQGVSNQFDIEQSEEGLRHISDVIQNVSQNLAYDFAKGIGAINEAVSTAGATASAAGVSFEEFSAMVGKTIEVTRQSGSTVGNAYKTIFSRITKASKVEATPDEDVSNAEKSLRNVGIAVRDTASEFREVTDILSDLGKVWDTLDTVTQSEISYNLAGVRQTNILKSLLSNWEDYENLVEETNNATGTTLENQEKYAESIQGRMSELKATAESFWTNILNSGELKTGVSLLTNLLKILDGITGKLGSFGSIGMGLGAYLGIRNAGRRDVLHRLIYNKSVVVM